MFELKRKFKYRSTSLESVENMLKQKCKLEYRRTSLEAEMNILKQKCKLEYGSTTDCGTPSMKNLQRTPSDQSSSYKKYSPATTARSNPSTLMFKQKHKSESSLETVESNTALRVSSQSNLDRDHANVGDNDTCPQVANSSSETTHHHHRQHYPSVSPFLCKLENNGTSLEAEEDMLKQKCRFE